MTIGCDPELVCRINGKFSPAYDHFKARSSMGLDGNESVAELRPGYSESPIDLTAKIRTVLEYGYEKNNELEFYSGHYVDQYPIGGHIHLGTSPSERLTDNLETLLGSFSNCVDDKIQRSKRSNTGYGAKKAIRRKSYGIEYRTPGSWLLSPSTTLITFTLAKLAAIGADEDNLDFFQLKDRLNSCTFLKNLKDYLITIPEDCQEGLSQMDILLEKKNINWDMNILPNWGIGEIKEVA